MRDFLFRAFCFDKNGKMNYDRASKLLGYTKSDLIFMMKNESNRIDTHNLLSGVYVGFHPTSKSPIFFAPWQLKTCYHSKADLSYMDRLIFGRPDAPKWATYEYFIMDANGNMLFKTPSLEIEQTIDENGVIHLKTTDNSLNEFVYPVDKRKYSYKKYFCYGRSLESLNSHIKDLDAQKYIKRPKHFKNGFSKTPQHPLDSPSYLERQ